MNHANHHSFRRPQKLALACATALGLIAATPLWAASCTAPNVCGTDGADGGNATSSAVGAGGFGSNHAATDGSVNDGGAGGSTSNNGKPGQGAAGSGGAGGVNGGGALNGGGGGGGGNLATLGVGGGGGGGSGYVSGSTTYGAGGGGGGGGGPGQVVSGAGTNSYSIVGGQGGRGGQPVNSSFPGGGGGGGSALVLSGSGNFTFQNASGGALSGGSGGMGGNSSDNGGANGGNGGTAVLSSAPGIRLDSAGSVTGGAGGGGGGGGFGGGSGGDGGDGGAAASGTSMQLDNKGSATGGAGGAGGDDSVAGSGGNGAAAVLGSQLVVVNHNGGSLDGGAGGAVGSGVPLLSTSAGAGGAGVHATGASAVTNAGHIGGGLGGDGSTRAHAIDFSGGNNTLTLEAGYDFVGDVVSSGGDTLALGGSSDASFNLNRIGAAKQYQGFEKYGKTGSSTWTLAGSNTTPAWTISAGTLRVNVNAGAMQVNGGVLAGTGHVAAISLAGGAIAPGDSIGTLHGASLDWSSGSMDFQLGSSSAGSDRLGLLGALRGNGGSHVFDFSDGTGTPQIGTTYTLITFGSVSGLSASDFSYTYTGANADFTGYFELDGNSLKFVADRRVQTINFPNPGPQVLSQQSLSVNPTASSGLPVSLISGTPTVCTVSGSGPTFTVDLNNIGTCTLSASQGGDASYNAAPTTSVSFAVGLTNVAVPTLGGRALALLGLLLGLVGFGWQRRQSKSTAGGQCPSPE